jgi:hypothetical protein
MTNDKGQQGPIHQPHPDDPAGSAEHAPSIAKAIEQLPAGQAERVRAAMEARLIAYEERPEGVAVLVDGFELCVVPAETDSVDYPSAWGGATEDSAS